MSPSGRLWARLRRAPLHTARNQNLINSYVQFRDIPGSLLYQRDNALDATKMPPVAKNMVDEAAMANLRQWIASPLEVLSVNFYQDNSHLMVQV